MHKRVVVIGDVHLPFEDEAALEKAHVIAKQFDPDMVIQVGDLNDQYSASKYPRSLNLITPEHEMNLARSKGEAMWSRFRKDCKRAKLVQLVGNHDARALKRCLEFAGILEEYVSRELKRLMSFPGVETVFDEKEEFVYDGVLYQHGYRKFGDHARYNQMNTVCGHLHLGGVVWDANLNGPYFELNAGWLGDKRSLVFGYRAQKKLSKTTVGVGLIDSLGPRFISLE